MAPCWTYIYGFWFLKTCWINWNGCENFFLRIGCLNTREVSSVIGRIVDKRASLKISTLWMSKHLRAIIDLAWPRRGNCSCWESFAVGTWFYKFCINSSHIQDFKQKTEDLGGTLQVHTFITCTHKLISILSNTFDWAIRWCSSLDSKLTGTLCMLRSPSWQKSEHVIKALCSTFFTEMLVHLKPHSGVIISTLLHPLHRSGFLR